MSGVLFVASFIACGCGIESIFTGGAMVWGACFAVMLLSGIRVVAK